MLDSIITYIKIFYYDFSFFFTNKILKEFYILKEYFF